MDAPTVRDWKKLYADMGLVEGEDGFKTLAYHCPHRSRCWEGTGVVQPEDEPAAWGVYEPWVGPRYDELRLVVVAQNMNQFGGWGAMRGLVESARQELKEGRRRLRFGNEWSTYRGTLLFHRAGAYAGALAGSKGLLDLDWLDDGFPGAAQVAASYDFMAMTNLIKCSPDEAGSPPTPGMWGECAPFVLRRELALLKPSTILVLGYESFGPLRTLALDDLVEDWEDRGLGLVQTAAGSIEGRPVRVIAVPHPHARGFRVKDVLSQLKEGLQGSQLG